MELHRCESHVFCLPVNICTYGVARQLFGLHNTPCALILFSQCKCLCEQVKFSLRWSQLSSQWNLSNLLRCGLINKKSAIIGWQSSKLVKSIFSDINKMNEIGVEMIQKLCIWPLRVCQNAKHEPPRDMLPTKFWKFKAILISHIYPGYFCMPYTGNCQVRWHFVHIIKLYLQYSS